MSEEAKREAMGGTAQLGPFLLGLVAWAADELISYSLVYHACSTGHFYVLHVVSLLAFATALAGAAWAWRHYGAVRQGNDEGGSALDRAHFVALSSVLWNVGIAVVIIAAAVPRLILSPCD